MRWLVLFACALALPAQRGFPERPHGRSMTITHKGIVATSQTLASQAGATMLARGGNAVDAAIAANAVLGLMEPMMDGIGGDLFVLYREAKTGKLVGLNSSGPAGQAMSIAALKAKGLSSMPPNGIHTVTVPGAVRGWQAMHARYGKLPWKTLFTPAIELAERGFAVHEFVALYWDQDFLRRHPESLRRHYLDGRAPREGDLIKNPDLARAYRLLADKGPDAFYKGEIARAILSTSDKLGGLLKAADLARFEPEWVNPISTTYRGWKLHELPPNGQGLAALLMLNMLETFEPAPQHSTLDLHRKIEAMKLAYADLYYVADPRTNPAPLPGLLSKGYAAERAKAIDAAKANCQVVRGTPPAHSDTTYFSVVDSEGNITSWIQSVSGLWGSGVTVEGMGFVLHNRGSGFQFDEQHPNALKPGKRPFHTIIPALLEKDEVQIGFGIMGGANQPLAHAQFVSSIVDHGLNLQASLEAPRFSKQQPTGCDVYIEKRVGEDTLKGLGAMGHFLTVTGNFSNAMGHGNAVMRNLKTGLNYGASDPRGDGAAIPEP